LIEIRSCVEGAVEGCLQRAGQVDESAGAIDVDGAIGVKDAEDDSADSKLRGVMKFFTDRVESRRRSSGRSLYVISNGIVVDSHRNLTKAVLTE
jgi:hypothetical protein